jgi:hypothetical protein
VLQKNQKVNKLIIVLEGELMDPDDFTVKIEKGRLFGD